MKLRIETIEPAYTSVRYVDNTPEALAVVFGEDRPNKAIKELVLAFESGIQEARASNNFFKFYITVESANGI